MAAADAKAKIDQGAAPQVAKPAQAVRKGIPAIVTEWAAGLIPKNAPDARNKGPLAWVREVEVGKLIEALAKEGYK